MMTRQDNSTTSSTGSFSFFCCRFPKGVCSMRNILFLMLVAAVLSGCVTTGAKQQQRGTAEIIEKDGGKWVHVLGTGVEFPLLGAWEEAMWQAEKQRDGSVQVGLAALTDNGSLAMLLTSQCDGRDLSMDDALSRLGRPLEEVGASICRKQGRTLDTIEPFGNGILFLQCGLDKEGSAFSAIFIKPARQGPLGMIGYLAEEEAHEVFGKDAEEMMRRVEVK